MVVVKDPYKYTLIRFEKSNTKNKKYDAVIRDIYTGKDKRVPFGDSRYQHYKDTTNLKLYSNLDHGDLDRRWRFKRRHWKNARKRFSSAWFADHFLWR